MKFKLRGIALSLFLALGLVSCGGGGSESVKPSTPSCDLTSQRNEQRLSGKKREDYYPKVFSRDFSRDYGADISPEEEHYDIVRKVSRSVFEIEFIGNNNGSGAAGTGWLIAPRYLVTAAHNFDDFDDSGQASIRVHTFDGDTIEAEKIYADPKRTTGTDLALLRLKEESDAIPMKIAEENPEKNELLMGMGGGSALGGLGGWTVSAGPALELREGRTPPLHAGRIYHAVPAVGGMSGGPIFNDKGEVVSIISASRGGPNFENVLRNRFGVKPFRVPSSPPQNLWVYGFVQPDPGSLSFGPNPAELREVFDKIPDEEKPDNAGEYGNGNRWEKAGHEFGNEYSPFPLDQFDHMQDIYKRAREATVELRVGPNRYGSGFIYDADTVITAGHVAPIKGETVYVTTNDLKIYNGTVFKTQYQAKLYGCDIAVIKTNEPLPPGEHQILEIADGSSLQCGDPLVVIGSADFYNSVGHLQGVGAVYMSTETYISKFISHSSAAGMSGGPVVDKHGRVVSLSSTGVGKAGESWRDPGPLVIRTRLPVYFEQDFFEGPNAETIKRFVDEDEFLCPE